MRAHVPISLSSTRPAFRDAATFDEPTRYAPGVKYLFVNGVALIEEG